MPCSPIPTRRMRRRAEISELGYGLLVHWALVQGEVALSHGTSRRSGSSSGSGSRAKVSSAPISAFPSAAPTP